MIYKGVHSLYIPIVYVLGFKNSKFAVLFTFTLVSAMQKKDMKTITKNNDSNNQLLYKTMNL